jgi:hypothetical protein
MTVMYDIENARQKRAQLQLAADYIMSNEKAVSEFGSSLEWKDLENIPTWLLWNQSEINHLVLTAGTIFLLPSIRIWIDSKKIQEIRKLIGDRVFEFLMTNTHVDNQQILSLNMTNVTDNVLSAGAAVILSSHSIRIRPWLQNSIPKPKGKLDRVLAEEIMKHALFALRHTRNESSNIIDTIE